MAPTLDDAVRELGAALSALSAATTTQILSSAPAIAPLLEALEAAAEANGQLDAALEAETEAAQAVSSLAERQAEALLASTEEACAVVKSRIESFLDKVDDEALASVAGALDKAEERLAKAFDALADAAHRMTNEIERSMHAAVDEAGDNLRAGLEDEIRRSGRAAVEAAVQALLQQVLSTLVTTQLGVAVTGTIGPYLPAIAALRVSLEAIHSALELLRAGV